MFHRLEPHPGQPYLEPEEVVERFREEFVDFECDREEGEDHAGDVLAKLIELGAPQVLIDQQVAHNNRSVRVWIDDESSGDFVLSFVIQPGTGLFIGYESADHERAVRPLVERCANALNYRITTE